MNDRTALIRVIAESPDDPLPRLVFADWLDDHDHPHWAEFVRIAIEMSALNASSARYADLDMRSHEIRRHRAWFIPLPRWVGWGKSEFHLGLLDVIRIRDIAGWLAEGEHLLDQVPTIRGISIRRAIDPPRNRLVELMASPHLARISSLDLSGNPRIDLAVLAALVASPCALQLRRLILNGVRLRGYAEQFFHPHHFPQLERLDWRGSELYTADRELLRQRLGHRVVF